MHQRAWEDVIGDRSILFESRISADQYSGTGSAINPCPLGRVAAGVTLPFCGKVTRGLLETQEEGTAAGGCSLRVNCGYGGGWSKVDR